MRSDSSGAALCGVGGLTWFAFRVQPGQDAKAERCFDRAGIETAGRVEKFKAARAGAGRSRPQSFRASLYPGYLFVRLGHDPRWDVLFGDDPWRGLLDAVLYLGAHPARFPDAWVRDLGAHVIVGQFRAVRARAGERLKASRPIAVGDRVEGFGGPVQVQAVEDGVATLPMPVDWSGRAEFRVPVEKLRRVASASA